MNRRTAKPDNEWKDGFLFLGNHPALDFLNTRPVQNGDLVELIPDFNALLRWFLAAELLSGSEIANLQRRWGTSAQGRRTLEAARQLRERLRKEILTWEVGGAIHRSILDELNQLMAHHPMRMRLKLDKKAQNPEKELWFKTSQPNDLLAPLAHSAAMLFTETNRDRVRKCGQCVLHFYDKSKKGTRRWCSMHLCGNRLKVAAYAARQRMP